MAEWRVFRGWSEAELEERLERLDDAPRNFRETDRVLSVDPPWRIHRSRARLGSEPAGPPRADGAFARGRDALVRYAFSDPAVVEAHFDPTARLLGRRMLLELKPGPLRYLCGVIVSDVRDQTSEWRSVFGFRYDTLEGHIEAGCEWFLLEKDHRSGELTLEIEAAWRPGDFPNWWSRVGFELLGRRYQVRWHVEAHRRMAAFVAGSVAGSTGPRGLAHQGPEVVFGRRAERP